MITRTQILVWAAVLGTLFAVPATLHAQPSDPEVVSAPIGREEFSLRRRQYGIEETIQVEKLATFVGTKFFEIRGRVKGILSHQTDAGDYRAILLERNVTDTVEVEVPAIPSWLKDIEMDVRMVVRADRADAAGPLRLRLIEAMPASGIADLVKPKPKPKPTRTKSTPTSRSNPNRYGSRGAVILPRSEVEPIYAAFIRRQNPRLTEREAFRMAQGVIGFSLRYGVEPRLIMAIIMVESGFNPAATSYKGAMGLGQLMPRTANGLGVRNAYDSIENIYGMIKLMRQHLEFYRARTADDSEVLSLALAAYNAGAGAVKRHGGIPPYKQTQRYVVKVMQVYRALTKNG